MLRVFVALCVLVVEWFFQAFASPSSFTRSQKLCTQPRPRSPIWPKMIKVTTEQGKSYEGDFYALDPVTKSLALKGAGDSYMIINTAHIVSMTGNVGEAADVSKFGVK